MLFWIFSNISWSVKVCIPVNFEQCNRVFLEKFLFSFGNDDLHQKLLFSGLLYYKEVMGWLFFIFLIVNFGFFDLWNKLQVDEPKKELGDRFVLQKFMKNLSSSSTAIRVIITGLTNKIGRHVLISINKIREFVTSSIYGKCSQFSNSLSKKMIFLASMINILFQLVSKILWSRSKVCQFVYHIK